MRLKHKKLFFFVASILLALCLTTACWIFFTKIKAAPRKPNIHGYVSSSIEGNPIATISWGLENAGEYGFRIIKKYGDKEKTAAIFNPAQTGDDSASNGFYADSAVAPNETYTYKVFAFDRTGEDYYLGEVTLKIAIGQTAP